MAISNNKEQLEKDVYIESSVSGQPAIVVTNPDGSNVGGSSSGSTTGTVTSVNDSASSATLLALNTLRRGASIYNDSTEILYVKCGATASLTSFTAKVGVGQLYEIPFGYTGIVDGIWANNAAGAARITEYT